MKILIKIEEYLPETQQIVVKFCSSQSEKSIDDVQAITIDLDKLELFDTELFLESLSIQGHQNNFQTMLLKFRLQSLVSLFFHRGLLK